MSQNDVQVCDATRDGNETTHVRGFGGGRFYLRAAGYDARGARIAILRGFLCNQVPEPRASSLLFMYCALVGTELLEQRGTLTSTGVTLVESSVRVSHRGTGQ